MGVLRVSKWRQCVEPCVKGQRKKCIRLEQRKEAAKQRKRTGTGLSSTVSNFEMTTANSEYELDFTNNGPSIRNRVARPTARSMKSGVTNPATLSVEASSIELRKEKSLKADTVGTNSKAGSTYAGSTLNTIGHLNSNRDGQLPERQGGSAIAAQLTPTQTAELEAQAKEAEAKAKREEETFKQTLRLLEVARENEMSRRMYGGDDKSVAGDMAQQDSDQETEDPWVEGDLDGPFTKEQLDEKLEYYCQQDLSHYELIGILNQLRRREIPAPEVALRLTAQVHKLLRDTCKPLMKLEKPSGRIIVVGDLHGHLADLWHIYTHVGMPSDRNQYLFNGDFVDRGVWGPEVVIMIFTIKLLWPNFVWMNRGNHESKRCTAVYGFRDHLSCAYQDDHEELYELMHEAFNMLPLCTIVADSICVMHGGLPKEPCYLEDIKKLERGPVPFPGSTQADALFQALLWSDPMKRESSSDRGLGWHFSKRNTERFLFLNGLMAIVRSHQCVDHGYQVTHAGLVTTVFSSSNYDESNNANIAVISSNLQVSKGMKFGWNEVYMKPEWLAQVVKPEFDVTLLEDNEGYLDFTAGIHRQAGEQLGIEMSMDHPILEIPIVTALHEGCVMRYNQTNPEIPIEVGDAILEVNGACGYDKILEAILATQSGTRMGLYMRMRRPERHVIQMDRVQEGDPDVNALGFPDNCFIVAPNGWGSQVHKYDRILEVNGHNNNRAMRSELLKASMLDILLLRYAPTTMDFTADHPVAQSPALLRSISQSGYEDVDQDQRTIDALRARLGGLEKKEVGSVRRRVLEELKRIIWAARPQLLENFTDMDRMNTPRRPSLVNLGSFVADWGGYLTAEKWAQCMSTTLRTPEGFPWLDLLPHIYRQQKDEERVSYVRFLMRFHNKVSRWLLQKWCSCALDRIVHGLDCTPEEQFRRLDPEGIGKLSYNQLRGFFQKMVFPHEASTKTEKRAQELRMFTLFLVLESVDESFNGCVVMRDFVEILALRSVITARLCPDGHWLTPGKLPACHGFGTVIVCDDCGEVIPLDAERRYCTTCEWDLCLACATRREVQDVHNLQESAEAGIQLSARWRDVEKVVHLLCSFGTNVELVFGNSDDHTPDSVVDQARAVSIVGEILGGRTSQAEAFLATILDYLKTQPGHNEKELKLGELMECLYIQEEDRVL